ncbi:hypothetical protein [Bosea sp. LjRoot237]|uniref:hypothetical protein n=1 Tax=Bosea sp. LjRoot237 TaxID=3342292 RepID=UPI003ED05B54
MHGLERLHASLDQFFYSTTLNSLPIGERVAECFCETVIADGVLRYLPDDETEEFERLMLDHLGVGVDDFDEDHMRDLFATRDFFSLQRFISGLFELKGRLQKRLGAEVL